MRNFDEERAERFSRDATFQIGGQEFRFKIGIRPEVYAEITKEWRESLTISVSGEDAVRIADETIEAMLFDDAEIAKWREVRQREEEPITSFDMGQVIVYMMGEQLGRPTEAAASSSNGSAATGQPSTEPSSSPVEGRVVSEA